MAVVRRRVTKKIAEPTSDDYASSHLIEAMEPARSLDIPPFTLVLGVLLIIAAFLLGMFYTKVRYLEADKAKLATIPTLAPQQAAPIAPPSVTTGTIKKWAKDIKLDTKQFNSCFDQHKYKDTVDQDQAAGQTAGVSGTPSFFINGILLVGAQPYTEFQKAIDGALNGTQTGTKVDVATGHFPALGQPTAPVTMIEFSDFECPFCHQFYKTALLQIKKDYIDTGKVVMYYRHFPLPFHPSAQPMAEASECAKEQGKFWEMHDKMFSSQS